MTDVSVGTGVPLAKRSNMFCRNNRYSSSLSTRGESITHSCLHCQALFGGTYFNRPSALATANSLRRCARVELSSTVNFERPRQKINTHVIASVWARGADLGIDASRGRNGERLELVGDRVPWSTDNCDFPPTRKSGGDVMLTKVSRCFPLYLPYYETE